MGLSSFISAHLWKGIPEHEHACYNMLTAAGFSQMFIFWIVVPLKSGAFAGLVGTEYEPMGKIIQLFILGPTTLGFNKLVALGDLSKVSIWVMSMFCFIYILWAFIISFPGLNPDAVVQLSEAEEEMLSLSSNGEILINDEPESWLTMRQALGWCLFVGIDVFIATINPMFWSVASTVVHPTRAKRVYPRIILFQQFGAFIGATVLIEALASLGFPFMLLVSAGMCALVGYCLKHAVKLKPASPLDLDEPSLSLELESKPLLNDYETSTQAVNGENETMLAGTSPQISPKHHTNNHSPNTTLNNITTLTNSDSNSITANTLDHEQDSIVALSHPQTFGASKRPNHRLHSLNHSSSSSPSSSLGNPNKNPNNSSVKSSSYTISVKSENLQNSDKNKNMNDSSETEKCSSKTSKTGLLEGIRLIFAKRFVFGILVISCLPEVAYSILSFRMKLQVREYTESSADFSSFMALFGQISHLVSALFATFLTPFILKNTGVEVLVVAYPCIALFLGFIMFNFDDVWVAFGVCATSKTLLTNLAYSTKELFYTHCSQDIRIKAKSWIDMFGIRLAKAGAAVYNIVIMDMGVFSMLPMSLATFSYVIWYWFSYQLGIMHAKEKKIDPHYILS